MALLKSVVRRRAIRPRSEIQNIVGWFSQTKGLKAQLKPILILEKSLLIMNLGKNSSKYNHFVLLREPVIFFLCVCMCMFVCFVCVCVCVASLQIEALKILPPTKFRSRKNLALPLLSAVKIVILHFPPTLTHNGYLCCFCSTTRTINAVKRYKNLFT